MTNRTFTPFQLWLETQLAGGRTLTNVGEALGMSVQQLSRVRAGRASFPKPRLQAGLKLTGLSLPQLLEKASPKPRVGAQVEAAPGGAPAVVFDPAFFFPVTPERVHVALQHGLKFGPERAAFCDAKPKGDLDKAWRGWCRKRGAVNGESGDAPPAPTEGGKAELYGHLKTDIKRADFRPDPDLLAAEQTGSGAFSLRIAKPQ